jgi:hypothetical protein
MSCVGLELRLLPSTGFIGITGLSATQTRPAYLSRASGCSSLITHWGFPFQAANVRRSSTAQHISLRFAAMIAYVARVATKANHQILSTSLKRATSPPRYCWPADSQRDRREWWKTLEARAHAEGDPVNPRRELSPRLPDRAIVTSDSGSCANCYARDLKMRRGMMASFSGGLASMGAAVPYAIGQVRPLRQAGDRTRRRRRHADEQQAERITVAKYCRRWETVVLSSASSTTRTPTRSLGSSG